MINNVTLMGRLTADAELRTTTTGKEVTSFCIAVERPKTSQEKTTDFINIVAWGKTAKFIVDWFKKGEMIALTGSIQTRSYEDKNGEKRTVTEVIVANVSFCGGKQTNKTEKQDNYEEITDDDLLF